MFDQAAAQRAAQRVIAAAPRIEGGDGNELVINIKNLVAEIVAAGQPDAAVVPAYDATLASTARYRLEAPDENGRAPEMTILAHRDMVGVAVFARDGQVLTAGAVGSSYAWHLGMALCSASQDSARQGSTVEARS